jgi:hypothetical protein
VGLRLTRAAVVRAGARQGDAKVRGTTRSATHMRSSIRDPGVIRVPARAGRILILDNARGRRVQDQRADAGFRRRAPGAVRRATRRRDINRTLVLRIAIIAFAAGQISEEIRTNARRAARVGPTTLVGWHRAIGVVGHATIDPLSINIFRSA